MSRPTWRPATFAPLHALRHALLTVTMAAASVAATTTTLSAQAAAQRQDEEYTRLIKQHLTDPRITTELVDHLPFSDKVPTTLKFPGINRIVGTPGYLTKAADIHRYLKAVADAAPDAREALEPRQVGRRARHDRDGDRRRGDHHQPRQAQGLSRRARGSAEDERDAREGAHGPHQARVLHHERHALHGDGRPRDADGARVSSRRRGDAVRAEHPQERASRSSRR